MAKKEEFIIRDSGFIPDFSENTDSRFFPSAIRGLYFVTIDNENFSNTQSALFLKGLARIFFFSLSRSPSLEEKRDKVDIYYDESEIEEYLASAPYMIGSANLSTEWVYDLFKELFKIFQEEIKSFKGSVEEYFVSHNSTFRLPSRIFFHLKENPKGPTPFAFMATYSTIKDNSVKHFPLKYALKEYKGNIEKLAVLISSIKKAAAVSAFIASLLESGEIFFPLNLSKEEAYQLLLDSPKFEELGIVTRIPLFWHKRKRNTFIDIERKKNKISSSDILSLCPSMYYDGVAITKKEAEDLLNQTEGLELFKGQWIEIDKKKLQELLKTFNDLDNKELSVYDAFKLSIGLNDYSISIHFNLKSIIEEASKLNVSSNPPLSFAGILRPYQTSAYSWLLSLSHLSLSPLLADDMGLGKTVEVLSFLEELRVNDKLKKVLLIVPASLVGNWDHECQRFTPQLERFIYNGKKPEIFPFLTITTYQRVNKSPALQEEDWDYVILDEAQNIKNPKASQTKAIKGLKRKNGALALTGTPIENNLMNLWSIFDFLMPGLLGEESSFKNYSDNMDSEKQEAFKETISPFILRRLKTDKSIISDLPEKIENTVMVTLSKTQRILYNKVVDDYEEALKKSTEPFEAFTLASRTMMKLKQLLDHPDLYLGQSTFKSEESGKFLLLGEIAETLHQNREKVLVFTQFKSIIPALKSYLESIFGVPGASIDGSTPKEKRTELVDAFQRGEYPFMVLSLKAGGVGLTLTEATNVIHFDRWWNPAVENQATDRAYRIGQKKKVTVYKFLALETIEEKINEILESKSKLSSSILGDMSSEITSKLDPKALLEAMKFYRSVK